MLVGLFFFALFQPLIGNAYATYNRHRLTNGVGNYGRNTQYYYIDSTAKGEAARIRTGMIKWVHSNGTGAYTPISFRETTHKPSSIIDIEKSSGRNGTVAGTTWWYNNSTKIDPMRTNWYWSRIILWGYYNNLNQWDRNLVCAHEIGHAFGLNHENNTNRLMNPNGATTKVNGPTRNELDGITALYK